MNSVSNRGSLFQSAIVFAAILAVGICLYLPSLKADAQKVNSKTPTSIPIFVPDAITSEIRDPNKRLVRIAINSTADLQRAESSGRVIQNFGKFVLVSEPRTSSLIDGAQAVDQTVNLPSGAFDPIRTFRSETVSQSSFARVGSGYFILQLGVIATDDALNEIRSLGIEVLQYVPHNAFLVYASGDAILRATSHPRVRWIGSFLPDEKLSTSLKEHGANELAPKRTVKTETPRESFQSTFVKIDIAVAARADVDSVAKRITREYGAVNVAVNRLPNNFFDRIRVDVQADRALAISEIPDVIRIDPASTPRPEDERAAQIVAGNYTSTTAIDPAGYNPLGQFGYDGSNVTVAVVDDGISIPGNGGFYLSSTNTVDGPLHGTTSGASGGHGHLNASIIAGAVPFGGLDPLGYNYGEGIAPGTGIVNIPFLKPPYSGVEADVYNDAVSTASINGVKSFITNNSWGTNTNSGKYETYEAEMDGYVRDASSGPTIDPLVLIFSAGNQGPVNQSLTKPKAAKNLIAVGNSENLRTELSATGADNIDDLNASSSRGPTFDGRIKPDVVAPGSFITGSRAGTGASLSGGNIDANHVFSTGTSHSAPQVAGAAALFTQFWKSNHVGQNPSPALVKAAIVNSAQEMNGAISGIATIPNGNEGWGRLDLKPMLGDTSITGYINESVAFNDPGGNVVFSGSVVDATKPVRFTLVWTDPPGSGDPALVNDLDLSVQVGPNIYNGNNFAGGSSVIGGVADIKDNVENVFLLAGTSAGTHVNISISASALNGDGVLGNADLTDQSFALVAYNFVFGTTAAPASIAGRVTDSFGRGISRTIVTLTNSNGSVMASAATNTFGYYRFESIPTGETYLITPRNKKYTFTPPTVVYNHFAAIDSLNFVAE